VLRPWIASSRLFEVGYSRFARQAGFTYSKAWPGLDWTIYASQIGATSMRFREQKSRIVVGVWQTNT
jgi:hypothetical protein